MNKEYNFSGDYVAKEIIKWIKDYFAKNAPEAKAVIGISGGKDSTICAALLCEALGANRVVGVLMPNGEQHDIDVAKKIVKHYNMPHYEINIADTMNTFYDVLKTQYIEVNKPSISTNSPARIRMAILYAVAADVGGLVVNTSNLSEIYVGYSTKWGDGAGDFGLLRRYCVEEAIAIGKALNIPSEWIEKIPEDGMSGVSDEEKMGFTYNQLDNYLLRNIYPDAKTLARIVKMHKESNHKRNIDMPCPQYYGNYARCQSEDWVF